MKNTGRKILWAFLVIVLLVGVSVPEYLYWSGLRGVTENRAPLSGTRIPESVAQYYWRFLGGEGAPSISSKSPHGFIAMFLAAAASNDTISLSNAEHVLLSEAARSLVLRERMYTDWHLSVISALIWISRNWTVDEIISTVLLDAYYGHRFYGIDSAARGYFGLPLSELTDVQMTYIFVIEAAPSHFDPWCNPEVHRERFNTFSERLEYSAEYDLIKTQPMPDVSCE